MKVTFLPFCLLTFLFTFPIQTFAVDFTVTRSDDRNLFCLSGENCSFREAVNAANLAPTDDTINFVTDLTLIITIDQIDINNAGTLTINGNGANVLTIRAQGSRILFTTGTVNISGVTLTGGIAPLGTTPSTLSTSQGGAIFAQGGSLILDRVHVTGNVGLGSGSEGGGIYFAGGTHRITNSTFSNNRAGNCGGILASGTFSISNSTFSGNSATTPGDTTSGVGGGLCNFGAITMRHTTITDNSAGTGSGVYQFGSTLDIGNSIIAGNTLNSSGNEIFSAGKVASVGGNLIGDSLGDSTNIGTSPIVYHPTDILDTPLLLQPLQNNGGPTPTHALLEESSAVDAGLNENAIDPFNNLPLGSDQRIFQRIVDGNRDGTATVDIGAFEVLGTSAASVSVSGRVTASSGRGVSGAVVRITNQNGETRTAKTNFFGYYKFTEIMTGETYVLSAFSKQYRFDSKIVNVTEDLAELDFTAQ